MIKVNGKKIKGIQAAVREWQSFYNNSQGWNVELWYDRSTGEVWAIPLTQNSWSVYHDSNIVSLNPNNLYHDPDAFFNDCDNSFLYDTYKGKLRYIRQAIEDVERQAVK